MAAAVDIISGGRLELGIGAGWNEEESGAYGIELGSIRERFDRFEEACAVLTSLLSQEATDFDGKFYQLKGPATSRRDRSGRTRRSASAAAGRSAPCGSPPATPSTGTSSAARRTSSPTSATCWPRTARTSGAIPRRSCSAHLRLEPDLDYGKVIDDAAALAAEGLDLGIVYLPPPHDPRCWSRSPRRSATRVYCVPEAPARRARREQTHRGSGATSARRSHTEQQKVLRGDQTLVLGGELAALHRMTQP